MCSPHRAVHRWESRFRVAGDAVKIQRVCASKEFRGKGVGAEIIGFIVGHARRYRLAPFARLGARTHALEFYRKLGFEAYGEDYLELAFRIATCS